MMTGSEDFRFIFFGIDFGGMGYPGVEPGGPGSGGAIFFFGDFTHLRMQLRGYSIQNWSCFIALLRAATRRFRRCRQNQNDEGCSSVIVGNFSLHYGENMAKAIITQERFTCNREYKASAVKQSAAPLHVSKTASCFPGYKKTSCKSDFKSDDSLCIDGTLRSLMSHL